jgi:hypothetical protein
MPGPHSISGSAQSHGGARLSLTYWMCGCGNLPPLPAIHSNQISSLVAVRRRTPPGPPENTFDSQLLPSGPVETKVPKG